MSRYVALATTACSALIFLSGSASAGVDGGKNGLYFEHVKGGFSGATFVYRADTVTRLCFAGIMSPSEVPVRIPCERLARRPGWSEVLTWVTPSRDTDS